MVEKIKAAIIGPGNIGTDLLLKAKRSKFIEIDYVIGVKESEGIEIANEHGIRTTTKGLEDAIEDMEGIEIVFDATGARHHMIHAPLLKEKNKFVLDLTPAAVGPYVVPSVNLDDTLLENNNLNMVTCGGQATVPIVSAINKVADVQYAEIVSSVSSRSAGEGTRQNIDEFTETTREALEKIGGADKAKVIIVLNPAEPPILMSNTIYTMVRNPDMEKIKESIDNMLNEIKKYVPGYRFKLEPILDGNIVTTMIEVEGLGDYLPKYAGNLDIITSASIRVAERYAAKLLGVNLDE